MSFIPIIAVIYYIHTYLYKQIFVVGYFLVFIVGPLLYVSIRIFNAKTKKDFHFVSNMIKLVMLLGMLSLLLYKFILFI